MTAAGVAQALAAEYAVLVQSGAERPVTGLGLVEAGQPVRAGAGDLVIALGSHDVRGVLDIVEAVQDSAGLVLRREWAEHAEVRARCAELSLPLLALAEGASWSAALAALHAAVEAPLDGAGDHVGDLFGVADTISAVLQAPVTIEDATSRVLAYSTGQTDIDEARRSTIVGRRVPAQVRDHFRALGVFRRLAHSDEPFFVPAGEGDVRARYIVPVRAGGEWLGSIWAVVDDPVLPDRTREIRAATEVVALYLLRLRARSELHLYVQLDQVRSALRGSLRERPAWLDGSAWRAVLLDGPPDLDPEARSALWSELARRHGWRQPLLADLDGAVCAIVRDDATGPGSWPWLREVLAADAEGRGLAAEGRGLRALAGRGVRSYADLAHSATDATELGRIDSATPAPTATTEEVWPAIVLARAVSGQADRPLLSPLATAAAEAGESGTTWLATVEAVLDHWGEPQRAAAALGVHPNTVRYRMARLTEQLGLRLDDPAERLATRLEIARLRAEAGPDAPPRPS